MKLKYNTFGTRLILALVSGSILPIIVIMVMTLLFIEQNVETLIREQSEAEKKRITMILRNHAEEVEFVAKAFARVDNLYAAVEQRNTEVATEHTKLILDTLAEIDGAIVYTEEAEVLATHFREPVEVEEIVNETILARTIGTAIYEQEGNFNYIATTDETLYFVSIVQIQNLAAEKNRAKGALVLYEKVDQLFLQKVSNNFGYNIALISQAGDVQGTWKIKRFIENNAVTLTDLQRSKPIFVEGTDTLLIPVQTHIWAMISFKDVMATIATTKKVIRIVFMISILVALVWSSVLRLGITRPIRKLVQKLNEMRTNKRVEKLPIQGPEELKAVAIAFNDLVDSSNLYREQSVRDGLTNSFNQRYLQMYLESIEQQKTAVTVFFADLDHFKNINDVYGHDVGDQVICSVGDVMTSILGEEAVVSRYGGEEFVAIIPKVAKKEAYELAEKIRCSIEQLEYTQMKASVTISIGLSDTDDTTSLKKLVKLADQAMYQAKRNGRNRVIIYQPEFYE